MKTVKVRSETHGALKRLKAKKRAHSLDQVIREMIRETTGKSVEDGPAASDEKLTEYIDG